MSEIEIFSEIVIAISAIGITVLFLWYYRRFKREALEEQEARDGVQEMTVDPVCGMTVDPDKAASSFEYKDKTYCFCSEHCLQKFRDDPKRFINLSPQQRRPRLGRSSAVNF